MPEIDTSLLTAALAGYQQQLAEIQARIAEIQKVLGGHFRRSPAGGDILSSLAKGKRRKMSAAARKRIAEAQRKRWAAYRKGKGGA